MDDDSDDGREMRLDDWDEKSGKKNDRMRLTEYSLPGMNEADCNQ